jgi:transcriptional regulator NrdR family protein
VLEEFWMRRRRCCTACDYRWTTLEVLIDAVDLIELKKQQQAKEILQREAKARREKIENLKRVYVEDSATATGGFKQTRSNLLNINTKELKNLIERKK